MENKLQNEKNTDPFVAREHYYLDFWQKNNIFQKIREKNKGKKKWSFLDGPITANNPMGVHHGWGRTLKDFFQRYYTMKGCELRYQNGFDCQGLWVEVEVEKELGFKNKKDIENYGIDKFVEKCQERVNKYSQIQTNQSIRLGYQMDWEHSYYTMSEQNNYTIWYFLKTCFERGYLYKGHDCVPWCPRCGTAISQHEILSEEYQELVHQAIFFKLPIQSDQPEWDNTSFLVWTTTPWTIPANTNLGINTKLDYLKIKINAEFLVFAKERLDYVKKYLPEFEIIETFKGAKLINLYYQSPFDSLDRVQTAKQNNSEKFHLSISADEIVNATEGTGILHLAPGCGAEDFIIGKENKLPIIDVIEENADYLPGLGEFSGQNAKNKPEIILDFLKTFANGKFFLATELYTHRYPICWRCKAELVWRVVDEWYIAMDREDQTKKTTGTLRQQMIEVAKKIDWIPDFGLKRELDWLENMHDWLISKKRYWGLALPIFECSCGEFTVIGSFEELKEKAIEGWEDFDGHTPHRPWVDKIKIKCPKCDKTVSRIKDVGNPWLDAGIVPFSTITDPEKKEVSFLTDKKYFNEWFPADFITECFPGQFKNWFYSLIAMGTVLAETNPFKQLLGHSNVMDEKGEEMHKSKGNAIWFDDAVEKMSADIIRWMYLGNNPVNDLRFGYNIGNEIKRKLLTLWNVVKFYHLFSEQKENNYQLKNKNILDQWILTKFNLLLKETTQMIDERKSYLAVENLEKFIIDDLSTWYIRRSRDRFKGDDQIDKQEAINTLYFVLKNLAKILAPFMPFSAEEIYQKIKTENDPESVHLTDWPEFDQKMIDQKLITNMEIVRQIVSLAMEQRSATNIPVRQILSELIIYPTTNFDSDSFAGQFGLIIQEEINVQKISFQTGDSQEFQVELKTEITPELKQLGTLRDLIRNINNLRKNANLTLSDKVEIFYQTENEELKKVIDLYQADLLKNTLATDLKNEKIETEKNKQLRAKINQTEIWLGIK